MLEMNGMTYMTEEEFAVLPEIEKYSSAYLKIEHPSEEFCRVAVCLNPLVLRYISNPSWLVAMLAVKLNHKAFEYSDLKTKEFREAAAQHNENGGVLMANLTPREGEAWANAMNIRHFGLSASIYRKNGRIIGA